VPVALTCSDEGIAHLHLGADENRFSLEWMAAVHKAFDEIIAAAPMALVTSAEGKVYSNGLDLPWLLGHLDRIEWYIGQVHDLLARTLTLPVLTAFGAGAMFALAHDTRVMRADRGFLCLPEVDLRIPFTPGMTTLLQTKLTPQAAAATMLTGARVPAEQAMALGMIEQLASADEVLPRALGVAAPLVGKDPVTLRVVKKRMYAAAVAALGEPYVPRGENPGIPGNPGAGSAASVGGNGSAAGR
jgi:enoyl-CoA hydratase/carnithine racemase